jgi:hypothetical protein
MFSFFYLDHDHWTTIADAVRVIQYQLDQLNLNAICDRQTSGTSISIHYINIKHAELGMDETKLDNLCRKNLVEAICHCLPTKKCRDEWAITKNTILQRTDYGQLICVGEAQQAIILFGLPDLVKYYQDLFDQIHQEAKREMDNIQANAELVRRLNSDMIM